MTSITKDQADKAYREGNPLMTDSEYDAQFGVDASDIDSEFENSIWPIVPLTMFMGSLKKIKNDIPELIKWSSKYCSPEIHWSEKLDGSSGELTYENGQLVSGKTRGDGKRGNDITPNVVRMQIPKTITEKRKTVVRVEYILMIQDWKTHLPEKKNPRNAAAGTVNRKDGNGCEFLKGIAFDIEVEGHTYTSKTEKKDELARLGFLTPKYGTCSAKELESLITKSHSERSSLPYEIDGLVFEANDTAFFEEQGIVDQRPRAARAFKFADQGVKTVIKDVAWQVGKMGDITPVGLLDPTDLQGITISRVMLNNPSELATLNLGKNCEAELIRANDVIPKISNGITKGEGTFDIPRQCPSCGSNTVLSQKVKSEVVFVDGFTERGIDDINKQIAGEKFQLSCPNFEECPAQGMARIVGYLRALDVKGFAEKTVEKLIEAELISNPADLYTINTTKFANLEGMSDKIVDKLLKELHNKTEKVTLPVFIKAIAIKGFSASSTEKAMAKYSTLEELRNATVSELESIDKIGSFKAKSLVDGLKSKSDLINELLKWVNIQQLILDGKLSGQSFCFTGFRDPMAEKKIKELGGTIKASATKDLTYLVAKSPDGKSSKLEKARKNGSQVIGIEAMLAMLE